VFPVYNSFDIDPELLHCDSVTSGTKTEVNPGGHLRSTVLHRSWVSLPTAEHTTTYQIGPSTVGARLSFSNLGDPGPGTLSTPQEPVFPTPKTFPGIC
jgi:hypothetical protein